MNTTINESIKAAGFQPVKYSKTNDAVVLSTTFERDDNNQFVSNITRALRNLQIQNKKMSAVNIAIASGYKLKEIELNLTEIENIMNALGID